MRERGPRSSRRREQQQRSEQHAGDGGDQLSVALDRLEQGVERLQTSEEFQRYLAAMGRFHDYSFNNVLLILLQRPEAQRVASFKTWKQLGRYVNKGEKGIRILVPSVHKEVDEETGEERERLTGFRIGSVFDVSQTNGTELPSPPPARLLETVSDRADALYAIVTARLAADGVTVKRGPLHANGLYEPRKKVITLREDLRGDQRLKTLVHETGHHVALKRGYHIDRADEETIAESSAFVVLSRYGIDAAGYSLPYVAGWAKQPEALRRNLATIRRTSTVIINAIESAEQSPEPGQELVLTPVFAARSVAGRPTHAKEASPDGTGPRWS